MQGTILLKYQYHTLNGIYNTDDAAEKASEYGRNMEIILTGLE